MPDLGQGDGAVLLVDLVVFGLELLTTWAILRVPLQVAGGRAGDDERGAGFVDQDVVDLVHDGKVMAALDTVLQAHGHVVAQVVEAELGVGAVGDVGGVGLGAVHQAQLVLVLVRGSRSRSNRKAFLPFSVAAAICRMPTDRPSRW